MNYLQKISRNVTEIRAEIQVQVNFVKIALLVTLI